MNPQGVATLPAHAGLQPQGSWGGRNPNPMHQLMHQPAVQTFQDSGSQVLPQAQHAPLSGQPFEYTTPAVSQLPNGPTERQVSALAQPLFALALTSTLAPHVATNPSSAPLTPAPNILTHPNPNPPKPYTFLAPSL